MSAAPPGFVPGPPYAAVNDRIEICPDYVQGRCNSQMCSLVHPGVCVSVCLSVSLSVRLSVCLSRSLPLYIHVHSSISCWYNCYSAFE